MSGAWGHRFREAHLRVVRLLLHERQADRLFRGVCMALIEAGAFARARIVQVDASQRVVRMAGEPNSNVKKSEIPDAIKQAALGREGVIQFDAAGIIPDNLPGRPPSGLAVRMESHSEVMGLMTVTLNGIDEGDEQIEAFRLLVDDVALGLYRLHAGGARSSLEDEILESKAKLAERIKELNCLYAMSRLEARTEFDLDTVLQNTVTLIPPAWQYPEITCARLVHEGSVYITHNFCETEWVQYAPIRINGRKCSALEVFYLEERCDLDEGPFLAEERELIDTLAENLGRMIERLHVRLALREREQTFRDLLDNSLMGIIIVQDGQIVYMNPEQKEITGSHLQLYGPLTFDLIHTDDVERVKALYAEMAGDKSRRLDMDFRILPPKDGGGEPTWVYCRASHIVYNGADAVLINLLDVTKEKKIDSLLRIQDKMTSLGHVAAGIAHEIRNPLSGINIFLSALDKMVSDHPDPEKTREIIRQMQSASTKIESVIRRVMDFSRPVEPKRVSIDILQPIEEAVQLSSVTMRKIGVRIENAFEPDLPRCLADPQLIEQVFLNMITNAAEAMKSITEKKVIRISAGRADDRIVIEVSDSGPGVPHHMKEKIFDPFYTTKNGSTGIGLSLSHRIIADHGGSMEVSTSAWGGAKFIVKLPILLRRSRKSD